MKKVDDKMRFSNEIKDSPTLKLSEIAREKEKNGETVISLAIGEPDFKTPEFVKDGITKALNDGFTGYSNSRGLLELREKIVLDFKKRYQANYNTNEVLVLPGAKMAIFLSLAAILEENDEVIIISPFYVSYQPMIKIAEVSSKIIDIPLNKDFSLPTDKIRDAINKNTKALILNYPNNPTGMFISEKEINEIIEIVNHNNIYLISDEIYDKLNFSDDKFLSFSSYPSIKDNLILINGYSKTYAMTGFRIGYVLANSSLITKINLLNQNMNTNTNTFVQKACLTIYDHDDSHITSYNEILKARVHYFHAEINKIKYFSGIKPKGGFYYFIDISKTKMKSEEFSNYLINNYNLVITPGIAFGEHFDSFVRISLATDLEVLKQAIAIFRKLEF